MGVVFILFLLLLLFGMPAAFAIGISGAFFLLTMPDLPLAIIVQRVLAPTQSFNMLAVPLFVFAGNLMNKTGITNRLIKLANVLTGHMHGNLAQTSCLLSVLMGGVSGSANADAAMQCRIFRPAMQEKGYSMAYGAAVNGYTSLIVATIPPSMGLIIYGSVGEVSIGRLFMGGFVPAILLAGVYMFTIRKTAIARGYAPERKKRASIGEIGKAALESIWALIFPVILIAGIRFGIFTPSESGAFACVYAVLIGAFVYKELSFQKLKETLKNTAGDIGLIMVLVSFSGVFGYGIVYDRVPQALASFLTGITDNKYLLLVIIIIMLVMVGTCIETTVIALLMTPILLPVITAVGVDPVHFGLIMMTVVTMGIMTPPMGIALFTTSSLMKCSPEETTKASIPFIIATLAVVTICVFFERLVLFLPDLVFG